MDQCDSLDRWEPYGLIPCTCEEWDLATTKIQSQVKDKQKIEVMHLHRNETTLDVNVVVKISGNGVKNT